MSEVGSLFIKILIRNMGILLSILSVVALIVGIQWCLFNLFGGWGLVLGLIIYAVVSVTLISLWESKRKCK